MKTNHTYYKQFKQIISISFILFLFNYSIYSQTMDLYDVEYHNTQIPHCSSIDLNFGPEHYITFKVRFEKPYYGGGTTADLAYIAGDVFVELGARGTDDILVSEHIHTGSWTVNGNGNSQYFELTGSISISNSQLDDDGGVLFARYKSNNGTNFSSCDYDITRPEYILSPSNSTISCGQSAAVFSVSDEHNSLGNLVYHWSVESGWSYNGITAYNFTTTTNSISLVPTSYPPGNVHVTPYLDGVPYEQLTSNVSLGNFNTNNQIVGNSSVCSTENYYLQNALPSGWSVSWSLDSTNIATITQNGNNATVTRNSNQSGYVTIIATFTNSCNQTVSKTLEVFVGHPLVILKGITGDKEICSNEVKTYRVNIPTCIGDVNWSVSPNLHITDEGYDYITVEENFNSTSNFGYVSVSIPDLNINLDKIIFVGVPLNSEQLYIRKISSYNLSSYRWTKFKVHPMIDFDNIQEGLHFEWQIPNSLVRHFTDTSIIDIKPNFIGILNIGVRACNDCGCGDWKYKSFNVISPPNDNSGNGSIIEPR